MIGIIDYRMGNLRSVQKAFEAVGADAVLMSTPDQMSTIDKLVLPGVGAFSDGMLHLREMGWIEPIRQFIKSDSPFLGICLGMQLLFDGSEEDAASDHEPVPGLAVLSGKVVRFVQPVGGPRIKIPHMGWNTLRFTRESKLFAGIEPESAVYFVHGYYARPAQKSDIIAEAEYPQSRPFCCAVNRGNIWATQFHPEKSQRVGLAMLKNFAAM